MPHQASAVMSDADQMWVQEYTMALKGSIDDQPSPVHSRHSYRGDGSPLTSRRSFMSDAEMDSSQHSISRRPSCDNLWVDFSKEPESEASVLFRDNLLYHEVTSVETRLEPIHETVGFAKPSITGKGSLMSGVFTLVASAMGAGCLSLPHMLRHSGLGLGLFLLACGAALAHVSLVVLMSCARYTSCRSFAELVALSTVGPDHAGDQVVAGAHSGLAGQRMQAASRAQLAVDTVIALYGLAAVLIYMMLIGDFLGGISESPLFGHTQVPRSWLILGSLLVVLPLSLPRHVSALRHVCLLSTGSVAFMTIVVLAKLPAMVSERVSKGSTEDIKWVAGDWSSTLQSFAIAIFAFAAHTNAVPMVAVLEKPRAARIWRVSLFSVLLELVIYTVIAVVGYVSFLGETKQDFIRNYPVDDSMMLLVRCVYSVPVIFGVPINLAPAASSLQSLARRAMASASGVVGSSGKSSTISRRLPSEQSLHHIIVTSVLGVCAILAICSEDIADVIGLLGSMFGTLICLWWPHQIYQNVLGRLHSRTVSCFVRAVLKAATGLGISAFVVQFRDVFL